jgi:ADP-dependent phosphofructokinase/glucokinase
MAKVEYAFPVDKVHGKISKKHRIGFAHRKATARNYTTSYGERSTPVTSNEMAVRTKFTAVCAAARARLGNINQIPLDQIAFREQTKYKTMWGYVFRQEWDAYVAPEE